MTANSRQTIIATTHAGAKFNEIKNTKAVIVSILSANGSANFPKLVTKFLERAICPSKKSVIDATAKITAANT